MAARWSSDWESGNGIAFRRTEGLSRMVALSVFCHLAFFSLVAFGRIFWGGSPSLQSYQVTLVSPTSNAPSAPAAPPSLPQAPTPRPPAAAPARPAPPPAPVVKAPATKGLPPPPMKPDPERLQEWWKKKVGSIKIPPVSPKSAPAPAKEMPKRPMISPIPTESQPLTTSKEESPVTPAPAAPAAPAPTQEASASAVVAAAGAALNPSLFKFPYYLRSIQNKISENWAPPHHEEQTEAVIRFSVTRSGRIELPEVEKSSGNSQFDQAALRAVYNANPLPPLPEGLTEDPLKVHFSFTLQRGS
ncbi:MAG: TonB family protein [Nitrospirae bacterium]|nr:TonB family protein [Candidatus Manganitrophaceae bacterium]